jgi:hypothetical protein
MSIKKKSFEHIHCVDKIYLKNSITKLILIRNYLSVKKGDGRGQNPPKNGNVIYGCPLKKNCP